MISDSPARGMETQSPSVPGAGDTRGLGQGRWLQPLRAAATRMEASRWERGKARARSLSHSLEHRADSRDSAQMLGAMEARGALQDRLCL